MEYISQDLKKLHTLMEKINNGALRLPNFQRKYVWKYADVISLLDSIQHRYPAGSLLFYESGNSQLSSVIFDHSIANKEAEHLVMDGQQRLTSCYNVFYNHFSNTFYIDLRELYKLHQNRITEPSINFEDVIITRRKTKDPLSTGIEKDLLPFPIMKDRDDMRDFLKVYKKKLRENPDEEQYLDFVESNLENYLDPFFEYQFPIIVLPADLSLSSVCKIFQTVNTTGVKLDSFDICVAKFSSDDVDLKKLLKDSLDGKPSDKILGDDKYKIMTLQIMALVSGNDHKKNRLVDLSATLIPKYWLKVVDSINDCLSILDEIGVGTKKDLSLISYDVMIPVIASALITVDYRSVKKADEKARIKNIVKQYYYYSSFNERYKDGAATKMKSDYDALCLWINNDEKPDQNSAKPGNIFFKGGLKWVDEEIVNIKKGSSSAIGKAILAAINHIHPIDFYDNAVVGLGEKTVESQQHHIFPKAYYGVRIPNSKYSIDSIFNITYLSKETNNHIKDKATKEYFENITKITKLKTESEFIEVLKGHAISDSGIQAFLTEDYDKFIESRVIKIKEMLYSTFGLVIRSSTVGENDDAIEE